MMWRVWPFQILRAYIISFRAWDREVRRTETVTVTQRDDVKEESGIVLFDSALGWKKLTPELQLLTRHLTFHV